MIFEEEEVEGERKGGGEKKKKEREFISICIFVIRSKSWDKNMVGVYLCGIEFWVKI